MATKSATGRVGVRVRGPILEQPVAHNVEIVGFSDMDGKRDGLQMDYQEVDGRHYLYVGHFWSGGVSILDVTDPSKAHVVGFVPNFRHTGPTPGPRAPRRKSTSSGRRTVSR